jgi:hypothetical protein
MLNFTSHANASIELRSISIPWLSNVYALPSMGTSYIPSCLPNRHRPRCMTHHVASRLELRTSATQMHGALDLDMEGFLCTCMVCNCMHAIVGMGSRGVPYVEHNVCIVIGRIIMYSPNTFLSLYLIFGYINIVTEQREPATMPLLRRQASARSIKQLRRRAAVAAAARPLP